MAVSATTIRTSRATAIAALVLLLTGCAAQTNGTGSPLRTGFAAAPGSGTTPSTPSTPTTPAPPTPTATSVLTGPPSQVTLALAVVRAADLPLGWTPNPSSAASPAGAGCFGDGTTVADRTGVASSTFVNGVAVIAATATGFGAAADVTADAAFVRGPRLVGCLKNVIAGSNASKGPAPKLTNAHVIITPESSTPNLVAIAISRPPPSSPRTRDRSTKTSSTSPAASWNASPSSSPWPPPSTAPSR